MHFLNLLALTCSTAQAAYTLQQDYMDGGNFLDQFTFWTASDPTHGFVQYLSESDAEASNLIRSSENQVSLYVDSTETTTTGRKSIRISSKQTYQSGLIILDLQHMPGGICGAWPAFWLLGPDWPNQGEIDIIEGVNDQESNQMTLHSGPDCSISSTNIFSGRVLTDDCDNYAPDQPTNAGCSIQAPSSNTYGKGFNDVGGGVYATVWTGAEISIYFFPRNSIPADIQTDSPNPQGWGRPLAKFQGNCDIANKFTNQQIIFDTTFCGDWAGAVWAGSSCEAQNNGQTCEAFVGNNPQAFKEAYWAINSLKVFQDNGSGPGPLNPSTAPGGVASTTPTPSVPGAAGPRPTLTISSAPLATPQSTSASQITEQPSSPGVSSSSVPEGSVPTSVSRVLGNPPNMTSFSRTFHRPSGFPTTFSTPITGPSFGSPTTFSTAIPHPVSALSRTFSTAIATKDELSSSVPASHFAPPSRVSAVRSHGHVGASHGPRKPSSPVSRQAHWSSRVASRQSQRPSRAVSNTPRLPSRAAARRLAYH